MTMRQVMQLLSTSLIVKPGYSVNAGFAYQYYRLRTLGLADHVASAQTGNVHYFLTRLGGSLLDGAWEDRGQIRLRVLRSIDRHCDED